MKTLFDPVTEADTRFRVRQLRPNIPARWGKTTAPRVVVHLTESFAVALGEAPPAAAREKPVVHPLQRWLHLRCFPCPDRKHLVAPEVLPTELASWKADLHEWQEACSRFVTRGRSRTEATFITHPIFGPVTAQEWGQLVYFHVDHHLRQFGV